MAEDPPPVYAWFVLIILTALSGMFSGLNLGLMSLTVEDLNIVIDAKDDPKQVVYAQKILPLRRHGNLLLCTLLIGNTLVNVCLAVVTDPIWVYLFGKGTLGTILALALPSTLIVICGEIVPQSVCSRYALLIGAKTLPITYVFVVVTFVFAYPISKILDRLLGDEIGGVYTRKGLLQLIKLNVEDPEHAKESGLNKADEKILIGALTFPDHTIGEVMTPINRVYALPHETVLDKETFLNILRRGHTRIPVYEGEPTNIVGVLNAKTLLGIGFERNMPLKDMMKSFRDSDPKALKHRAMPRGTKCDLALAICKKERMHMLIVTEDAAPSADPDASPAADGNSNDPPKGTGPAIGIVTIEDFIEEIIGDEIVDEHDVYVDNTQTIAPAKTGEQPKAAVRRVNSKRVDASVVLRGIQPLEAPGGKAEPSPAPAKPPAWKFWA